MFEFYFVEKSKIFKKSIDIFIFYDIIYFKIEKKGGKSYE